MRTEQHTAAERRPSPYAKSEMRKQADGLQPRALSIPQFCTVYSVSRAKVYEEIKSGRLRIRKIGKATRIAVEDGESWFASFAEAA